MPVNTIPRPEVLQMGQTIAQSAANGSQSQYQQYGAGSHSHYSDRKTTSEGPIALNILIADADSCAPELVGIPYQNFSAIQRHNNYQWRKYNHKCTACGHDDHLEAGCLMWKGLQNKSMANDTAYDKVSISIFCIHSVTPVIHLSQLKN